MSKYPLEVALCATRTVLEELGITFVIAGGYARDTHFGRTPRDVDMFIVGITHEQDALLAEYVANVGGSMFSDYPGAVSDEIVVVYKVGPIDLIVLDDSCQSVSDVVGRFDYNINQWVMRYLRNSAGECTGFVPLYVGDHETYGQLVQVNEKPVTLRRATRMYDIATEVNWSRNNA